VEVKLSLSDKFAILRDIFHTLFPDLCLGCTKEPKAQKAAFCINCLHNMPYTDHFTNKENDVTKHFKGRISLFHGAALLGFREGSIVKNMLHSFKYKKRKEIGEILGEIAGKKFMESSIFIIPDMIIPVPVHPKKVKTRGYNQSAVFGLAIGKVIGVKLRDDIIIKEKWSESQTGKSRTARVKNVNEVFVLKQPELVFGKHILLVDDVVTTGATLEACCLKLKEGNVGKISVLSIAAAK
jgi:ComF family protein